MCPPTRAPPRSKCAWWTLAFTLATRTWQPTWRRGGTRPTKTARTPVSCTVAQPQPLSHASCWHTSGRVCGCVDGGMGVGRYGQQKQLLKALGMVRERSTSAPLTRPARRRGGARHTHRGHRGGGGQQWPGLVGRELAGLPARLQVYHSVSAAPAPSLPPGARSCSLHSHARCTSGGWLNDRCPPNSPPPPSPRSLRCSLTGSIADEVACFAKCRDAGAQVVSLSVSAYGYSQVEYDAIDDLRKAGILFVAAAGNGA